MDLLNASILTFFVLYISFTLHFFFKKKYITGAGPSQPPGKTGLPVIGESLQFIFGGLKGHPEKFVLDRMKKYSTKVFKTHLFGKNAVVMCGATGHKLLFSNEDKLVKSWWPQHVDQIFLSLAQTSSIEETKKFRTMLPNFLKPHALQGYVSLMDQIAQRHFALRWENRSEVMVHSLGKEFTFWVACRLFMSIEDPEQVAKFSEPLGLMASGIFSIPINLPGTPFNRAIKAGKFITIELTKIVTQRRKDLAIGKATPTQDIMSHMLCTTDENGKFMREIEVANMLSALLIGGHETSSSACDFIVKYLALLPDIYELVYQEQMEIAKSKEAGESLNWEDIQKMKYSWKVACEVLRMLPPLQGAFREAITDFMFNGYSVTKGCKLYWSAYSTHKNPEFFPMPDKFNPSRFDGDGPAPYTFVPFGGGPRMCPGKEYARTEILVFMHHLVKRFRWENIIPDEKVVYYAKPIPAKGLPVRLYPHNA